MISDLGGLVIFRNLLELPYIKSLIKLWSIKEKNASDVAFAYGEFMSEVIKCSDNFSSLLLDSVLDDENLYTKYISANLGENTLYDISRLTVSYFNKIYPTRYTVEISTNGTQWTQVGEEQTKADNGPTYPVENIEFDTPVIARYVKLNFTRLNSAAAGSGVGITEFEIYGKTYVAK